MKGCILPFTGIPKLRPAAKPSLAAQVRNRTLVPTTGIDWLLFGVVASIPFHNLPQGQNAPTATVQKPEEEKLRTLNHEPAVRASLTKRISRNSLATGIAKSL